MYGEICARGDGGTPKFACGNGFGYLSTDLELELLWRLLASVSKIASDSTDMAPLVIALCAGENDASAGCEAF